MPSSWRRLALALACVATTACSEDLSGDAACPALCPEQNLEMVDVTLFPLSVDSSIRAFPPIGTEQQLLLARRGDSLVTGVVLRFDSTKTRFARSTSDTTTVPILSLSNPTVAVTLVGSLILNKPLTIEVYDVDATAPDLDTAAVRALFRPDRLIADSVLAAPDTLSGNIELALPDEFVEPRVLARQRIRLGLLVRSDSALSFTVSALESGGPSILNYTATTELTTTSPTVVTVNSRPPPEAGARIPGLEDYTIVILGTPAPPPEVLAVGGFPASRSYLRFAIPAGIVETTTVVRAKLILTQIGSTSVGSSDSVTLVPRMVLAAQSVDPGKASLLLAAPGFPGILPLPLLPSNGGVREIELVALLQQWRTQDTTRASRALVLQSGDEGIEPQELLFHSSEAPEAVRPRLRITYIPRARFELP
ncbi:MAG: hypothetical protein ACREON_06795 [Gemmatimonadaceae bacterium]